MSNRFKFGAEILLKLRTRREEAARRRFARSAGDVEAIARRMVRLREVLRMHNDALRNMLPGGADAMNVRLYRQCIDDIGQAIAAGSKHLAEAHEALREQRAQLLEAVAQRKALAVMKDRQMAVHAGAEQRDEIRQQDMLHAAQKATQDQPDDRAVV